MYSAYILEQLQFDVEHNGSAHKEYVNYHSHIAMEEGQVDNMYGAHANNYDDELG